jgi:hypothetical protein
VMEESKRACSNRGLVSLREAPVPVRECLGLL